MIHNLFLDEQGNLMLTLLLGRVGLAILYIGVAALASWIVPRLVQRSVLAWAEIRADEEMSERRQNTIARLMRTLTRISIFVIASVAVLALFVDSSGLFTFLGLFTAALGFSLRQVIGDYISGFVFLFEDQFSMGDEVGIADERGTVEDVTMRTTSIRAETGELRIVPNGDIRTVYNYTRSTFCPVTVYAEVPISEFEKAHNALDALARRLPDQVANLDGVSKVCMEEVTLGKDVKFALQARTRKGSETELQRQMLAAMRQTLLENDIRFDGTTTA